MRKRLLLVLLLVFVVLGFSPMKSQELRRGIYVPSHVENKKPIPFQYVREADVMWSKTVWRRVQLREKMNLPLYYPEERMGDRMSLITLLLLGIKEQGLTAYDENEIAGDEFAIEMKQEEILQRLGGEKETKSITDVETGEVTETMIEKDAKPSEVKEFILKEVWFFDKQRSVMEVRLLGICPIRWYRRDPDNIDSPLEPMKICWIYYPEARKILANHYVFNPKNDIHTRSYDDVFTTRMFSSYIVRESNAYNDRPVNSYAKGLEAMLEAERIKESIFNYEQDLWHY